MPIIHIGRLHTAIYDRYVHELGFGNTTFVVPRDTNTLARLAELTVKRGDRVLDLGCGDGIVTLHAAACGAASAAGVYVNPDAIEQADANAHRAGLAHRVTFAQMDMHDVLTDAAARARLVDSSGSCGSPIDVVVSNPPYVPMDGQLAWQSRDFEAIRALPVTELGPLGRSDMLLARVATLRAAMIAAEDGGPDGLRWVRAILAHAPAIAARVAWLQASYTSPMEVPQLLDHHGLIVDRLLAYATPFATQAAMSPQLAYLSRLRDEGRAFFWSASAKGPHWMLLLGFSVRRDRAAGDALAATGRPLHELLTLFTRHGPEALSRWSDDVPFEIEVGCYDA